jgi:hypothetical protein
MLWDGCQITGKFAPEIFGKLALSISTPSIGI